jgi:hypothetical protein
MVRWGIYSRGQVLCCSAACALCIEVSLCACLCAATSAVTKAADQVPTPAAPAPPAETKKAADTGATNVYIHHTSSHPTCDSGEVLAMCHCHPEQGVCLAVAVRQS